MLSKFATFVRIAVVPISMFGAFSLHSEPAAAQDSATYTYDSLGRIQTVTYANGTVITYTYDSAGNRTDVVASCSSSGC